MKTQKKLSKLVKKIKKDTSPKYKTVLVLDFETMSSFDFCAKIEPSVELRQVRVK